MNPTERLALSKKQLIDYLATNWIEPPPCKYQVMRKIQTQQTIAKRRLAKQTPKPSIKAALAPLQMPTGAIAYHSDLFAVSPITQAFRHIAFQ